MRNIPNLLSFFRILAIPLIIILAIQNRPDTSIAAVAIFILASITDYLDGFLARRYQQETKIGVFLDLVADKLLVITMLFWLTYSLQHIEIFILSLVLISREIIISSLRQFTQTIDSNTSIPASLYGKLKTFFQMLSISVLLIINQYQNIDWLYKVGLCFLVIACFLSILSLLIYVKNIYRFFKL